MIDPFRAVATVSAAAIAFAALSFLPTPSSAGHMIICGNSQDCPPGAFCQMKKPGKKGGVCVRASAKKKYR